MRKVYKLVAAALVLGAFGMTASAAVVSGKKNLVCATTKVVACMNGGNCTQGDAASFEVPTFMFVDFKNKAIRAVDHDGSEVTSPVKQYESTDQTLIMQGFENHRGWTIAVQKEDGTMTLSATGPDVNFTFMGSCTEN